MHDAFLEVQDLLPKYGNLSNVQGLSLRVTLISKKFVNHWKVVPLVPLPLSKNQTSQKFSDQLTKFDLIRAIVVLVNAFSNKRRKKNRLEYLVTLNQNATKIKIKVSVNTVWTLSVKVSNVGQCSTSPAMWGVWRSFIFEVSTFVGVLLKGNQDQDQINRGHGWSPWPPCNCRPFGVNNMWEYGQSLPSFLCIVPWSYKVGAALHSKCTKIIVFGKQNRTPTRKTPKITAAWSIRPAVHQFEPIGGWLYQSTSMII